ncbi:uncharacterized protein PHALS_12467 [Plasmopara halstedii]|uniref:Uncharacterized protein n=1 Tax=Plasmopara halstedii TaxID=4781 RepID=A0A0P1ALI3_PLAHL|nr:uncharacterized protein PHALS_12467 [Plasmopara halstedii]CEG42170.1 hypothetical protein PHALS_12467 [Plasmopara halstedii]|eukprot:XP_024578539.1 hypothetical protein PHALS_12467 [Plasmopara halstedii]
MVDGTLSRTEDTLRCYILERDSGLLTHLINFGNDRRFNHEKTADRALAIRIGTTTRYCIGKPQRRIDSVKTTMHPVETTTKLKEGFHYKYQQQFCKHTRLYSVELSCTVVERIS